MEKEINSIIDKLTEEGSSLLPILMKTKVLAHRIKNEALLNWINLEINGYRSENELPNYRIHTGHLIGTVSNGFSQMSNTSIPVIHIEKKMRKLFTNFDFYDNIGSIESLKNSTDETILTKRIPADAFSILNHNLPISGGGQVIDASLQIGTQVLSEILTSVRSKLLEFLLQFETKFELPDNISEFEDNDEIVNELVQTTIYGNNNIVITGDHNVQKLKVKKGDLESLISALESHQVDPLDLKELENIISNDDTSTASKGYSPETKGWMKRMLDKALDGTWKVGISAAGRVLGNLFLEYYGF